MSDVSDIDYATWLTKDQAAEAIGVTTKTVERFVQAGQIQQARWQPEGRGPVRVVYQPDDVARIARERQPGPLPAFLVPDGAPASNGNGHRSLSVVNNPENLTQSPVPVAPAGDDVLRLLVTAAVRVMSETSQTSALFLSVKDAAALSGLSQGFLRKMIAAGTLTAIWDQRRWKIRRKDLEAL